MILATGILILVALWPVDACGPWFPETILDGKDEDFLRAPTATFRLEIAGLKPPFPVLFRINKTNEKPSNETTDAEKIELTEALGSQKNAAEIVEKYMKIREMITAFCKKVEDYRDRTQESQDNQSVLPQPVFPDITLPVGLPAEFSLYLSGAIEYHKGNFKAAIEKWKELLELPSKKRIYRSVWAAFMLGRALQESDPDGAVKYYTLVREMMHSGMHDYCQLGAASFGREAQTELARKNYGRAIDLYIAQVEAGDEDLISLRIAAARLLGENDSVIASAAKNENVRAVVAAHLISGTGPFSGRLGGEKKKLIAAWLRGITIAGVEKTAHADKLAWAAYQGGDFVAAAAWSEKAGVNAPLALWTKAKLALRDGKTEEAAKMLAEAIRLFSERGLGFDYPNPYGEDCNARENSHSPLKGELAGIKMTMKSYNEALSLLINAGYWIDAAYVAERVLLPDELVDFVDRNYPKTLENDPDSGKLRTLLARRLVRLGRFDDALKYFSGDTKKNLEKYVLGLETGHDAGKSKEERAAALWEAAKIARNSGMKLFGTELEPDWAFFDGSYALDPFAVLKVTSTENNNNFKTTSDEKERAEKHKVSIEKRYHYKYIAADIAWEAALLMPNNDDNTARVLCEAGTWLKDKDPKSADRFYKALVNRCRKTKLGEEADKLRWFPKIDPNGK